MRNNELRAIAAKLGRLFYNLNVTPSEPRCRRHQDSLVCLVLFQYRLEAGVVAEGNELRRDFQHVDGQVGRYRQQVVKQLDGLILLPRQRVDNREVGDAAGSLKSVGRDRVKFGGATGRRVALSL